MAGLMKPTRGTRITKPTKVPRKPKLNITKPTYMTTGTNMRKTRPKLG